MMQKGVGMKPCSVLPRFCADPENPCDEGSGCSSHCPERVLKMTRLMLGRTLERICKAVLLLCLVHFLIMMILYFDVYSQRFDIFSRFSGRNFSRTHHYYNLSRPNGTFPTYLPAGDHFLPSTKPETNYTPTIKPVPPCPEVPPGLGRLHVSFTFKHKANTLCFASKRSSATAL